MAGNTDGLKPFKPGQSGNPAGRPKGSRNKLSEAFWEDLAGAWETHGAEAVKKMAEQEPAKFVQVVASVMPKQLEVNKFDNMTDEQLQAALDDCMTQIGASMGWQRIPQEPGSAVDDGTVH